ncbi:MAG: hypothetical protein AMS27_14220 [Bacteroides sp. SM23_62_1]|nr:MAG: hypothetical protein AMS27_14220 [Bacteroides sp. SM23_62_1]
MTENKNPLFLKVVILIYAIVALVYGLCFLFVPDFLVNMSGGEPVFHGWLRWSGGVCVGLGIGSLMVMRNPKNQGIFVTTIALATLLAGLALVYAWIFIEEGANVWFTALPSILLLVISGLLWWSRQNSKDILKSDQ